MFSNFYPQQLGVPKRKVPPCLLCHSPFFSTFIKTVIYNHRNNWNPEAISGITLSDPTQIHRQAALPAGTEENLALLHPPAGPSPSAPSTGSPRNQSQQPSCTAPPLERGNTMAARKKGRGASQSLQKAALIRQGPEAGSAVKMDSQSSQ